MYVTLGLHALAALIVLALIVATIHDLRATRNGGNR